MRQRVVILGAALTMVASVSSAQTVERQTTVVEKHPSGAGAGAVTGAATGAAVGGPIGAAVGAVAGAVVGAAAAPPTEVRRYVTTQNVAPIQYDQPIVVGRPVAGDVQWLEVPGYAKYRWAYLSGRRVVVDASTHQVIAVYAADPPAEVRTYVMRQSAAPVHYGHPVVVGEPINGTVTWLDVPDSPKFRWAYIDGQRVVVDTDTNTVVAVY